MLDLTVTPLSGVTVFLQLLPRVMARHSPFPLLRDIPPFCHCEEHSDEAISEIATLPPACSPYDSSRRAKPWPACAKASARASGQVARNDNKKVNAILGKSGKIEKILTRSGDVIYSIPTIAQKVKPSKMSKIAGTVKIKERSGGVYPRLILDSTCTIANEVKQPRRQTVGGDCFKPTEVRLAMTYEGG